MTASSCFKADAIHGVFPIADTTRSLGLTQTTPPVGPFETVSQILFSPDGTKLLVSVKAAANSSVPAYLAVWSVNPITYALSTSFQKISAPSGSTLSFSITHIKGSSAYVVTDPALGFEIFDLATDRCIRIG